MFKRFKLFRSNSSRTLHLRTQPKSQSHHDHEGVEALAERGVNEGRLKRFSKARDIKVIHIGGKAADVLRERRVRLAVQQVRADGRPDLAETRGSFWESRSGNGEGLVNCCNAFTLVLGDECESQGFVRLRQVLIKADEVSQMTL